MTEPNNNSPQGQRPKTCGLAKDCFAASIGAALIAVVGDALASQPLGTFLSLPFAVIGLACGIFALRQITESKGTLAGWVPAITGIIISSVLLLVAWGSFYSLRQPGFRLVCGTNLNGLGKAMGIYSNYYSGKYPTADKWCDLLVGYDYANLEQFLCDGSDAKAGESSYAFNKDIVGKKFSEIPRDVVILFETNFGKNPAGRQQRLGTRYFYRLADLSRTYTRRLRKYSKSRRVYELRWNQVGGLEILTTDNHDGKGCNVLFNDGRVKFVETKDLGKLKWKVEEGK